MNQPRRRTIRKANPGIFQPDQEVIQQFVVRKREFDTVLEVLRGNIDASCCQHVLLVAPRGRGKTMLLARVAAELRTETDLSRNLLPVRFMEESLEIFDVADFWLECLFYLARETAVRDPELRRELRDTHDALAARGRGEELIEVRARAAVLNAADRLGQKLVFMVENLQDLCDDVDEAFGWKLREALQSVPEVMLLATATSRFKGLDDATQPFFELFRIMGLDPLDAEECRSLWRVLSGESASSREIKPLQILTGGSPRLLVFIADFAQHYSLRQLMEQLVRLIDDHTEYFRSHLEGFAKTERRVYLATIDLWQPSTAGEIAARARLEIRTVSTMLGRLVRRGAVIAEGKSRKLRYSAAERLYGIYYKLRRERNEAAAVSDLIRFMAVFYSGPELVAMSKKLSFEAAQVPAIREGIERVVATYDELIGRYGADDSAELQTRTAAALVCKGITQDELGDSKAAIATYDEVVSRFGDSQVPELQVDVARALANMGVAQIRLGCAKDALGTSAVLKRRYGALTDHNDIVLEWQAMWIRAKALLLQGKSSVAMKAFQSMYAVFRFGEGTMLNDVLKLVPELIASGVSERELLELVTSDPEKVDALGPLVVALRKRVGDEVRAPAEVIEVADDILEMIEATMEET